MTDSAVIYKVKTIDGEVLEISKRAADRSATLIEMLRNCPVDDVENMDPIVLDRAKGTIVKMIIQWCEDHKYQPILKDDKVEHCEEIKNQEKELLKDLDGDGLYDLFEAANWLDVRCLRQKIAKILAAMISGKKHTEIRTIWQLENDFTAEEEAQFSTEDAWNVLVEEMTKREAEKVTENVATPSASTSN
ncbi:unnamed protein product, partial [Mesorhabditis belari]|uniref:Skp1-related protein n=1 Tax=Mesorhabditis belari TaxID=2138241 RepID=A0AAF3F6K6_9BILA